MNWLLILLPALPLAGAAALATPAFRGRTGIGWGTGVSGLVLAGAVAVAAAVEVVAGAVATLPLLVTAAGKAHVATLMASATLRALFPF